MYSHTIRMIDRHASLNIFLTPMCPKCCCLPNLITLRNNSKKYDHITLILADLHWFPVQYHILFKVLVLTYHALHGTAPPYIQSLLDPYIPTHTVHSALKPMLIIPHSNTISYRARGFSCFAPAQYNHLPELLTQAPTLSAFKLGPKTHLFQLAFI